MAYANTRTPSRATRPERPERSERRAPERNRANTSHSAYPKFQFTPKPRVFSLKAERPTPEQCRAAIQWNELSMQARYVEPTDVERFKANIETLKRSLK